MKQREAVESVGIMLAQLVLRKVLLSEQPRGTPDRVIISNIHVETINNG